MFYVLVLFVLSLPLRTYGQELGGMLCRLPRNDGYECGVTSSHSAYHFDNDIGECIEFVFKGCGGNQNRFPTKEDCMAGCRSLTLCGKGMPLMDFAGNIKRCEGERVPCPGSHLCIGHGMNSVCCQRADRICQSSVNAGSSCGVVPITRYYFDSSSKTCRSFAFSGCGGNENNFKSKGECMQFCSSEIICSRGDPHPDRYSINQIASCMEDKHCPRNYTCTAKAGKKGACCPGKEFVCGSPFEIRSSCRRPATESVWAFDYRKGGCEKFDQPACDENWNSFANLEQCTDYCIGSCPGGLETHFNPLTGQPQLCDAKKKIGCPLGFECVKTAPFASICCQTKPTCPAAESLLLMKGEEGVRCEPEREDSCPEQYSCQQALNKEHICCTRPLSCPSGMAALRENGGRPRVCSVGVGGNCPADHLCVAGDGSLPGGARHLCCRPEKKCILPYVDMETKRPKRCFPGDGTCPSSTSCLPALEDNSAVTNAIDVMFYCCHTVDVFTCGDGSMPVIDQFTSKPMTCIPSDPSGCPLEMACSLLLDGSHSCCPHPLASQICEEAVAGADGPIGCRGFDDNSCAEGKCRRAANGRYYCCRSVSLYSAHEMIAPQRNSAPPYPLYSPGILYVPDLRLRPGPTVTRFRHRDQGRPLPRYLTQRNYPTQNINHSSSASILSRIET